MPWKETTVLDDRVKFIADYLRQELTMTQLCESYGISRKTGYKWIGRYREYGPDGLYDLPRTALSHPNATTEFLQERILSLRADHPTWGPRKLQASLEHKDPDITWPAASTIGAILSRRGVTVSRKRRRNAPQASPTTLTVPGAPNDVWCADFKGQFALRNRQMCYPLTVTDSYSRSLLKCQALPRTDTASVIPVWVAAFQEYGLPEVIRTDNGPPFASIGLGGLCRLSIWWIKLGIRPERIKPGKPQQNGQHERMHRTLKEETTRPPQADLHSQQRAFDEFRHCFNNERPHEALGQNPPSSVYRPSERSYPLRLPEVIYPEGMLVRRVRTNGCVRWHGKMLFISETLVGEAVGFDQLDDRHMALYFGPVPLAILDDHDMSWLPHKVACPILLSLQKEDRI